MTPPPPKKTPNKRNIKINTPLNIANNHLLLAVDEAAVELVTMVVVVVDLLSCLELLLLEPPLLFFSGDPEGVPASTSKSSSCDEQAAVRSEARGEILLVRYECGIMMSLSLRSSHSFAPAVALPHLIDLLTT